ncbi:hypothetical protein D3C85_1683140 [compost metagenome]
MQLFLDSAAADLHGGKVDRDDARCTPFIEPLPTLPASLALNPLAKLDDKAGFFHQGDKFGRAHRAVGIGVHAHQGLRADDAAIRAGNQGLVVQFK